MLTPAVGVLPTKNKMTSSRLLLAAAACGAPLAATAFLLARPTPQSARPWDAESSAPLTLAAREAGAAQPWAWEPLPDAEAVCLDGSQYGLVNCIGSGPIKTVYISIQGGGWCYDESDCLGRSFTALGSSSSWPAKAAGLSCTPQAGIAYVNMWYGDGASFTGYRADAWPVPGNATAKLYFRGIKNLDATLDYLFAKYALAGAELLVVNGGSAGGLSTFLHLDHVAARMAAAGSSAVVRGQPVCGYFLDAGNDGSQPLNVTYPLRMKYVYTMQNSTGSLSTECQSVYGIDAWKCIMAPHAAQFIKTPWFALQSRTDTWQLGNIAMIPCTGNPLTCPAQQWAQIQAYSPQFMDQWLAIAEVPNSPNGAFLDACLVHGSTSSTIDGLTNNEAFESWLNGGNKTHGNWWTMKCDGSILTGPCDRGPSCEKFPPAS